MSTHPNAILMAVLTPDDLSRKTMRSILGINGITDPEEDVVISSVDYHHIIMEEDYNEHYKISANEGDLVFFNFITYGYGETIEWSKLEKQKNDLDAWAIDMCRKFNCTYKIFVTANYW